MSSNISISVSNIEKCFHIYSTPGDRLKQFIYPRMQNIFGVKGKKYYSEFWALSGITFNVKRGDTVGIIGRNGSGKSTLLQIICNTLTPTSGDINVNGRIAALLELGSGFNPEYSGLENIYMNGSILGLTRDEINKKLDAIIAFADIGDFINQPVKTYSSGMMVRLAFSVSINIEPEILIIDEALAVGDELFQRKCFAKLEEIKNNGTTILFVSHSASQILQLCDRAILLNGGKILLDGTPKPVIDLYQKILYAKDLSFLDEISSSNEEHTNKKIKESSPEQRLQQKPIEETFDEHLKPQNTVSYESRGAHIQQPAIYTETGDQVNGLIRGRRYHYKFKAVFNKEISCVRFGMSIKSVSGLLLCGAHSAPTFNDAIPQVNPSEIIEIDFAFTCNLNPGTFFLNAGVFGIVDGEETFIHRMVDVTAFRVLPIAKNLETEVVNLDVNASVRTA